MMQPRVLLILCEGATEELYFDTIKRIKRIHIPKIEIIGKQGQHKALIKKCTEKRAEYAKNLEIEEPEIETWAVCDKDKLKCGYQKLLEFANKHNVGLAFSDPQFEAYLIQHFEFKKTKAKGVKLEKELSRYLDKPYCKTNLSWLENMIDEDPTRLEMAITNSNRLNNHSKTPFLTVQKLTTRLLELSR